MARYAMKMHKRYQIWMFGFIAHRTQTVMKIIQLGQPGHSIGYFSTFSKTCDLHLCRGKNIARISDTRSRWTLILFSQITQVWTVKCIEPNPHFHSLTILTITHCSGAQDCKSLPLHLSSPSLAPPTKVPQN